MSNCPYNNFKEKVIEYIDLLSQPSEEYAGLPPCPFAKPEFKKDKLMIEVLNPAEDNIIDLVEKLEQSDYNSAVFVQMTSAELTTNDTYMYQKLINVALKKNGYDHLKCVCVNPNDQFAIRQASPYFLINIGPVNDFHEAHKKLLSTKYFSKMSEEYSRFLSANKEEK
jgi:hypothetical protein